MTDTIVYTVVSKGGGIDGLDHTDKGGKVMGAYLQRTDIPKKYRVEGWYEVKPEVIDLAAIAKRTVSKLDPVERLALIEGLANGIVL
jgi:hypothetical protein